MRIDFVATKKNSDPEERELYEMDLLLRTFGMKRAFLDLGILTVAACTPREHEVHIVDEYQQEIDYDTPADLIALSAKTSCAPHAYEVADRFRAKGKRVVMGGIHASLRPDEALQHVDCVVTGEAEVLWPKVLEDVQNGCMKDRYDTVGFPPMDQIPVPDWDRLKHVKYLFHQIQTTRGCPFKCRFCSVPDISGQSFRFKPVDRVVDELMRLPRGGNLVERGRPLYIVDDNFISRTNYTKDLLRSMAPLYQAGKIPSWSAETTLNVAVDEEFLDLFRAAGCGTLIIGFESVSEASLKSMDKSVNFCLTFPEAVERIHQRGMTVVGNFIVGFDTDTRDVFRNTLDFIQETGILYPFFSILTPMPGTPLFDDTKAEGRLFHERWELYDTRHVVFEPKNLSPDELMDGYVWLYEQSYGNDRLWERMERNWEYQDRRGSTLVERLYTKAKLLPEMWRGDRELRNHFRAGLSLLGNRQLKTDVGQLLFVLDGYDFARFMRRFRSEGWQANYRNFGIPLAEEARASEGELEVRQWENQRAVRRTSKAPAV